MKKLSIKVVSGVVNAAQNEAKGATRKKIVAELNKSFKAGNPNLELTREEEEVIAYKGRLLPSWKRQKIMRRVLEEMKKPKDVTVFID